MLMYVKLFASLYQGTLRGCSDEILVFTNLLAHCDAAGVVDKHWRAICEETGLPRDRVEKAISNLEAADPESRSPEQEGRRIVKLDEHRAWGWQVVNYTKYRDIKDAETRREQNRIAQEKWRNKNKQRKQESAASAQVEGEGEGKVEEEKTLSGKPDPMRVKRVKAADPEQDARTASAVKIIEFLNDKANRAFQCNRTNIKFITDRLKDGATESQCRQVIARQIREWADKPEMHKYLRPETLFNETKFNSYVGQLVVPKEESDGLHVEMPVL